MTRHPSTLPSLATVQLILRDDEVRRTEVFLTASAALAVVGCLATWLVDGDALWRQVFTIGVGLMLLGYGTLWLHIRNRANYTPAKAVAVITACNLAGVAACVYYGLFSPAPMILMLPIAFIGRSASGPGSIFAYAVAAGSMAIPMVLVAAGAMDDPGVLRSSSLGPAERLLYAGLVQAVFAVCLVNGRASRRATEAAMLGMEDARRAVAVRDAQLEELNQRIDGVLDAGRSGPMTGQVVGAWQVGGLLGRGAMGDVYASTNMQTRQAAALKLINPVAASDPRALQLVAREARMLQKVESPHVVRLIEVDTGSQPWIAMELLRGDSLSERLRRDGRLPIAEATRLVSEVTAGLTAAANVDVLHRDLKPSNIAQDRRGEGAIWKLLDFGIAKQLGDDLTFTRGQAVGTPGYIAPEVLTGDGVDHRSDVFSLAAVAYRAVTGMRPFRGDRDQAAFATAHRAPFRPSRAPGVPASMDPVLAIGLAKDPAQRFQTAEAFSAAFAAATTGEVDDALRNRADVILEQWPWRVQDA